ncbi:MAG: class I SAM-dependent methyltransferase [Pirellulaceae bacterium]
MSNTRVGKNYDRAAWFYEISAAIFSAGKIRASKKYAVSQLMPGESVLFLGVGSGEDAVMAAERGATVTCIDLSQKMLDVLAVKLKARNLNAELICGDVFKYSPNQPFDAVCANYFFNIFLFDDLNRVIAYTVTLLRPGGKLLIADVARSQGNLVFRAFNIIYLKLAMVSFWILGLVPLHRNYDYRPLLHENGLTIDHIRKFRFLNGPVLFQTIVTHRDKT